MSDLRPSDLRPVEIKPLRDEPLADFVFQVIRADMVINHASLGTIKGTPRSVQDGGIDWQIDTPFESPVKNFGFFSEKPAIIQVKGAEDLAGLKKAVKADFKNAQKKKNAAYHAILEGDQYVLAMNLDLPYTKEEALLDLLREELASIFDTAAEPAIMGYNYYRNVARESPNVLNQTFPGRVLAGKTFQEWDDFETGDLPKYVPVKSREGTMAAIREVCDFGQSDKLSVRVQGMAGTGKTRLVLEAIRSEPETDDREAFCIYTDDPSDARRLFQHYEQERQRAILIADECPASEAFYLEGRVARCDGRVRIVFIDKTELRDASRDQGILPAIEPEDMVQILQANQSRFPQLSPEVLRRIIDLSGGYIRFALDMCNNHHFLPQTGGRYEAIQNYLHARMSGMPKHKEVLKAISLFRMAGYKEGARPHLREILQALGKSESEEEAYRLLFQLRQSTGFVNELTRYLYVTPGIVAEIFFGWAWEERMDKEAFVRSLDGSLLESFLHRVKLSGRRYESEIGQIFINDLRRLEPGDLRNEFVCQRARTIVSMTPETGVGMLEELLAECRQQGYLGDEYELEE